MPMIIDHLDHIAIKKNRTILYLDFQIRGKTDGFALFRRDVILENAVKSWLEKENIPFSLAGPVSWSGFLEGGPLYLYLDVPMDDNNLVYQKLCHYLEHPDGSMRFKNCTFCYLPLERCQEKARYLDDSEDADLDDL